MCEHKRSKISHLTIENTAVLRLYKSSQLTEQVSNCINDTGDDGRYKSSGSRCSEKWKNLAHLQAGEGKPAAHIQANSRNLLHNPIQH